MAESGPGTRRPSAGIVGLGVMGGAVGRRLVGLGWDVVGFDVDAAACEAFERDGGRVAPSPAGVVGMTTGPVAILVRTPRAAHDVVLGDSGIARGERDDVVVLLMSTVGPSTARRIARESGERVHVVDAPVSGGLERAVDGTLGVMVAGRDDDLEAARPLFDTVGETTVVVGTEPGAAQAVKLVNQAVMGTTMAAVAEGLRLAQRFGVDSTPAIEALASGTARSWVIEHWERVGEYWNPAKSADSLGLVAKDMRLALDELASTGLGHGFPLVASAYRELVSARSDIDDDEA